MDIQNRRCVYCGNVYDYHSSGGYYVFSPLNNDRYCPSCMKIINSALNEKAPRDRMISHKPFKCEKFDNKLLHKMMEIKDEVSKRPKTLGEILVGVDNSLRYDSIEKYCIDWRIYYICYNVSVSTDDGSVSFGEPDYYIEREYCPYNGKVGDAYVDYDRNTHERYSLTYGCDISYQMCKLLEARKGQNKN